jgi:16S rRNA (cytosine1402-N4)-methyltransferase
MNHVPVMLNECLDALSLQPGRWYIDGTFGAGGHTKALLEKNVNVLAIDQDVNVQNIVNDFKQTYAERFKFAKGNFRTLANHTEEAGLESVSGILLDIGVSSMQIDNPERGFAFRQDGPLDMRMSDEGESAADVVNTLEQEELAALIYKYGEERHSRRIARAIVEQREKQAIKTTNELVDIIQRAYPGGYRQDHPARRTFQALRIYVNDELGALEDALKAAESILATGGRLVVLSYHSLEDRIVKHALKESQTMQVITKRPLTATEEEVKENSRARSAKLRVAEKQTVSKIQALPSKNKFEHLLDKKNFSKIGTLFGAVGGNKERAFSREYHPVIGVAPMTSQYLRPKALFQPLVLLAKRKNSYNKIHKGEVLA